MKKRHLIIILFIFLGTALSFAQSPHEIELIKKKRFNKIEFFHASFGVDFCANKGIYAGPKVSLGIGSFRNLVNADLGFKFKTGNPLFSDDSEHLVPQQLAMFASAQLNITAWKTNCLFVGCEIAYCLPTQTMHYLPSSSIIEYDRLAGCKHLSTQIGAGVRLDHWQIDLYYEYDLAPALNQKYVYESANYDYDHLRDILFERGRMGVSLIYLIPFQL